MPITDLDQSFLYFWNIYGREINPKIHAVVIPEFEYRFHPKRRYLLDVAFPAFKVGIELDGGGRGTLLQCQNCHAVIRSKTGKPMFMPHPSHYSLVQRERDYDKQNLLLLTGWSLLRYSSNQLKSLPESVIAQVIDILKQKGA
jgi:very-short-patch-repair endonuclease